MVITREYKFGGKYDVVVCGGGPAGVAAAVSCAKRGKRTLLLAFICFDYHNILLLVLLWDNFWLMPDLSCSDLLCGHYTTVLNESK